ncbi:hypothetical protein D3C73_1514600 [compost metagenome]
MKHGGHCGHSHVNALLDELFNGAANLKSVGYVVGVTEGVSDGHEVDAFKLSNDAGMVSAHHPQSNEACTQICH